MKITKILPWLTLLFSLPAPAADLNFCVDHIHRVSDGFNEVFYIYTNEQGKSDILSWAILNQNHRQDMMLSRSLK